MRRSWLVLLALLALVAAACGDDRDEDAADGTDTTEAPAADDGTDTTEAADGEPTETTETTEPAADAEMFGTLEWPCSAGDGANEDDGSETGVTADSITIGIGDDAGFVSAPGLNKEMTDAMLALVEKCNELGGINGRTIETNYYDAKIFEVATAMQSACDDGNFMLVGQGFAFDSNQEEIRLGCELPSVPTYTVSGAFAHGPLVYQGVPNPADETPMVGAIQFARLFPEESQAMGMMVGNFSATRETRDKFVAVAEDYGFSFVSTDIEYNTAGEADWTPFVLSLKEAGAQSIFWSGSCLPNLQQFMQTAVANDLDVPVLTDTNHYDALCAEANTDGSLDDVYIRMVYTPFEEAAENPATQQYLDLVEASGGKTGTLGMQAASSFFLWATAADSCGATLTRQCALDAMAAVTEWDSGGLHAPANPGENHPPECGTLVKLDGTTYVRVAPEEPATHECDENGVATVTGTPALEPLQLDENRISRQFG